MSWGHAGGFRGLAVVNDAAVPVSRGRMPLEIVIPFPSAEPPERGGLGHEAACHFFEKPPQFSRVATPFSFPPGFLFLHVLASTCHFCLFGNSHCDKCEVASHCGFHFHFSDN